VFACCGFPPGSSSGISLRRSLRFARRYAERARRGRRARYRSRRDRVRPQRHDCERKSTPISRPVSVEMRQWA
jgi:hypothetical protein